MFDVVITKIDGSVEIWDYVLEIQASCLFFQARMNPHTASVSINEIVV
jgi:hypothetical protein